MKIGQAAAGFDFVALAWRVLKWPVLLGLAFMLGHCHGISQADYNCLETRLKDGQRYTEEFTEAIKAISAATAQYQVAAEALAQKHRTLREEFRRYVQTHPDVPCLDADGLRLWRDANAGEPSTPGSPDTGLREPPAAGERQRPDAAGKPSGSDRAVPRMPPETPRPGQLDRGPSKPVKPVTTAAALLIHGWVHRG